MSVVCRRTSAVMLRFSAVRRKLRAGEPRANDSLVDPVLASTTTAAAPPPSGTNPRSFQGDAMGISADPFCSAAQAGPYARARRDADDAGCERRRAGALGGRSRRSRSARAQARGDRAMTTTGATAESERYSSTFVANTPGNAVVKGEQMLENFARGTVSYASVEQRLDYAGSHGPDIVVLMGEEVVVPRAGRAERRQAHPSPVHRRVPQGERRVAPRFAARKRHLHRVAA